MKHNPLQFCQAAPSLLLSESSMSGAVCWELTSQELWDHSTGWVLRTRAPVPQQWSLSNRAGQWQKRVLVTAQWATGEQEVTCQVQDILHWSSGSDWSPSCSGVSGSWTGLLEKLVRATWEHYSEWQAPVCQFYQTRVAHLSSNANSSLYPNTARRA